MKPSHFPFILALVPVLLGASACSIRVQKGGGDGGVWFSRDRGGNFEQRVFVAREKRRVRTIGQVNVTAIAVHPRESGRIWVGTAAHGIYRSTNRGEQWWPVATGGPIRALATDPVNPNVALAIVGSRLLKTVDDGQNWQVLYVESAANVYPTTIVVHPTLAGRLYLGTSDGRVLASETYGTQWELLNVFESRITSILIERALPSEIYVTTAESGVSRSFDRGATFEKLEASLKAFPQSRQVYFASLQVRRGLPILNLMTKGGLLRSSDGGETFEAVTLLTSGPRQPEVRAFAVAPSDPQRLIYATATTLFRTLDGGEHWTTVRSPSRRSPQALIFDPENSDWIYLGVAQIKEKKPLF